MELVAGSGRTAVAERGRDGRRPDVAGADRRAGGNHVPGGGLSVATVRGHGDAVRERGVGARPRGRGGVAAHGVPRHGDDDYRHADGRALRRRRRLHPVRADVRGERRARLRDYPALHAGLLHKPVQRRGPRCPRRLLRGAVVWRAVRAGARRPRRRRGRRAPQQRPHAPKHGLYLREPVQPHGFRAGRDDPGGRLRTHAGERAHGGVPADRAGGVGAAERCGVDGRDAGGVRQRRRRRLYRGEHDEPAGGGAFHQGHAELGLQGLQL